MNTESMLIYYITQKKLRENDISDPGLTNFSLIAGNKQFSTFLPILYVNKAVELVNAEKIEKEVIAAELIIANDENAKLKAEITTAKDKKKKEIENLRNVINESKEKDLQEKFKNMFPIENDKD